MGFSDYFIFISPHTATCATTIPRKSRKLKIANGEIARTDDTEELIAPAKK